MKLEVSFPDNEGGPPKKFSINRTLRTKWSDSFQITFQDVVDEIKGYKGSFIGDMLISLSTLVKNENALKTPAGQRQFDVNKWASSLVEGMLYSAYHEELHHDMVENFEIVEWDGSTRKLQEVNPKELELVDLDKVMLLLAPKIKHMMTLLSKDMKKKFTG